MCSTGTGSWCIGLPLLYLGRASEDVLTPMLTPYAELLVSVACTEVLMETPGCTLETGLTASCMFINA